jgi:hypothetical protein
VPRQDRKRSGAQRSCPHVFQGSAALLQNYRYTLAGKPEREASNELLNRLRGMVQLSLLDAVLAIDPHCPSALLICPVRSPPRGPLRLVSSSLFLSVFAGRFAFAKAAKWSE